MIVDPPLLKIRRGFARPSAELLARFAGAPTGNVVDAMGGRGCLDHRIKPLAPASSVMVGTAVTCDAGPADNLALFGALHAARRGDILVAATDSFTATAITGDLLLGMARNRGVAGFVTDGLVRDIVG
ncbi:MAG: RraA family protein, partial [Roseiarcus sp.]